jgi:hypothetical protein
MLLQLPVCKVGDARRKEVGSPIAKPIIQYQQSDKKETIKLMVSGGKHF